MVPQALEAGSAQALTDEARRLLAQPRKRFSCLPFNGVHGKTRGFLDDYLPGLGRRRNVAQNVGFSLLTLLGLLLLDRLTPLDVRAG